MLMKLSIVVLFTCVLVFFSVQCKNDSSKKKRATEINYKKGSRLFKKYCDECHNSSMIHDMTAPALGYALTKRDSSWFVYHIKKGSYAATEDRDSISLALRQKGWGFMPSFGHLKDGEIKNIIFFINKEFSKNKK